MTQDAKLFERRVTQSAPGVWLVDDENEPGHWWTIGPDGACECPGYGREGGCLHTKAVAEVTSGRWQQCEVCEEWSADVQSFGVWCGQVNGYMAHPACRERQARERQAPLL